MKSILIMDFRVAGDLFYTEAVSHYCIKLGVESISSFKEIDYIENKVLNLMNTDKECVISSKVDKVDLVSRYFTALRLELRNA